MEAPPLQTAPGAGRDTGRSRARAQDAIARRHAVQRFGVSIEAGDPLAEADFHMAYGLYDQAADLVQLAIKREPQRRDLRLKLLEIFSSGAIATGSSRSLARCIPTRASESASEWDKVVIMGKQIAP